MATRLTKEEFIQHSKLVHGNKYSYDKVEYKNTNTKVTITCPIHGDFEQAPSSHKKGFGCAKCYYEVIGESKRHTKEQFINKAKEVHGNKYSYDKVEYINSDTKVTITCPEHGDFEQIPFDHIKGKGCFRCANEYKASLFRSNREHFIQKAKQVHGDKYDYSQVEYINSGDAVTIVCPSHGIFEQIPYNHLYGKGCPKCGHTGPSKGEQEVNDFIQSLGFDTIQNDRSIIKPKELDIVVL